MLLQLRKATSGNPAQTSFHTVYLLDESKAIELIVESTFIEVGRHAGIMQPTNPHSGSRVGLAIADLALVVTDPRATQRDLRSVCHVQSEEAHERIRVSRTYNGNPTC